MKERPIIFTAPEVRAILASRKTMTRRVVKPQPYPNGFRFDGRDILCHIDDLPANAMLLDVGRGKTRYTTSNLEGWEIHCPCGQPGERLWVRERWQLVDPLEVAEERRGSRAPFTGCQGPRAIPWVAAYRADGDLSHPADGAPIVWRSPVHMPRWASRITLEIESVRVERLHDISEADAMAEGCQCYVCGAPLDGNSEADCHCFHRTATASDYRDLWEHINGEGSWAANPWVWVLAFKRVTPP